MIPNPYLILAFLALLAGAYIGGYTRGSHIAQTSDQVVSLQKSTTDLQAALAASRKAFDEQKAFSDNAIRVSNLAAVQAVQSDSQIETLIEERDAYVRKLKGNKCPLSQSDVRSLRAIGGPDAPVSSAPAARGPSSGPGDIRSSR